MKITPFETEHFFAKHEFNTPYQLCNSDCETVNVGELLDMADMSLEQFGQEGLGYTQSQGNPQLRELIVSTYDNQDSNDVIVLGTPVEGIYLVAQALLEPGDEVIVLTPAYDALINVFEHVVGADSVKKWGFHSTPKTWELELDDLRKLISDRTKMVVVNFPHNPTGYLPTPAMQNELVAIAEANNLWLFCDEMYFGLVHSGTPTIPSMADLSQKSIVLSGLSKSYGLPGLRSGWLIAQDQTTRGDLMNWKFYTSICPPSPSEFLAIAALRVWEKLRDKNILQIEQNLVLAEAFFDRHPDLFHWRRPIAGSTALVGFDVPSVTDVAEQLAKEAGVLIQPATMLAGTDQQMRLGLGRAAFGEALIQFENWLGER